MKCLLTELDQSECSHCKTRGEQIRWFDAQYDGRCSHHACGLPIIAGERITEVSDGTYQHARCRRRA